MAQKIKILVTGASGVLGRAVVNELVGAGFAVRQGVRDLKKARSGVEAIRFDYDEPATIKPALEGVHGMCLIAPPLDPTAPTKLKPAIDAAKQAAVGHVVFISAFGANHNEQAPLRIVEHQVMGSGQAYTILRPNFFMENFSDGFLAAPLKAQGAIYLAAGDGKTSFISVADIARVVVESFRRALAGKELDLTGPEALDHAEVAKVLSEVLGREIKYHAISEQEMLEGARRAGMPESAVQYLAALYGAVRAGYAAAVTPEVEKITGRKPVSFREFAQANAAKWK